MRNGSGWRGLARACVRRGRRVGLAALLLVGLGAPATSAAQLRPEGAVLDGSGGVVALSSGDGHSCAIRRDGTVACWGANYAGQATPPEGRFIALSAGTMHTCGLHDDGRLECWGGITLPVQEEWMRYLAISSNGHYVCAITPEGRGQCMGGGPLQFDGSERVTALATGDQAACALYGDGRAHCAGPLAQEAPTDAFKAIAVGQQTACGLRGDGTVACWGEPLWGTPVPEDVRFTAITMGRGHACGLTTDGHARCWGYMRGALPPPDRFVALSAGAFHTCGLRSNGALACWGDDFQGATSPPSGVFGLGSLDVGNHHGCQVGADGVASCWGRNAAGQAQVPPPAPWEGPLHFTQVTAADMNTCGRRDDGTLQCWGDNAEGQSQAPAGITMHAPALGFQHGCGLGDDGTAQCWGWNFNGQAAPPADVLRGVSAAFVHTCGVRPDGSAVCWGYDGDGQLTPPPAPWGQWDVRIASIQATDWGNCALFTSHDAVCTGLSWGGGVDTVHDVRAYGAGESRMCWINRFGELACLGQGVDGQLTPPPGRYVSVSTGPGFACAIRSDGARVCWGDNSQGEYPIMNLEPHALPLLAIGQMLDIPLMVEHWTPDEGLRPVPGTFAVVGGALPPGLGLQADGRLVGVVTQGGEYTVSIEGRDEHGFVVVNTLTLRFDGTPPVVTAHVDGPLGENGWHVGPVAISWTYADDESAVHEDTGCGNAALTGDSPAASFTCTVSSAGGTTSREVTVKVDATAPDTGIGEGPAAVTPQATATFDFGGGDQLSGLARFECSLDDVPFAACTSRLTLAGLAAGPHVFAVRAVDQAGNVDATPALHFWRVDASAPVITSSVEGERGANGWYIGDVTVRWSVQDPDSPLETTAGCDPVTLRTDTPGAGFTCTASSVGGTASATVSVKRDATAPVIVAAPQSAPNANGWHRTDVVVGFGCSDAMSGVVACPAARAITAEGETGVAPVMIVDDAGNRAMSAPVTVRIDRTAPVLAPSAPASLLLNAAGAASANAIDVVSGVATQSCGALVTSSVGTRQAGCTATDRAGNVASATATYRVVYGFNGYTAPVQNAPVLNVFKAGRAVPLRWRVVDANGAPVTTLASASVNPLSIGCPTASENRISEYGGSSAALKNLGNGYYQLDWMAAAALRNLCRRLELDLGDGVPRPTLFKFN